jgi:hypothetical protein
LALAPFLLERAFVSDWTEGYVSDTEYTFGYYGELNPLRASMPFINVGLSPSRVTTACELGYGQGVAVNIHAAASDVRWYGTDFLPGHAASARHLADRAGSDVRLFADSFAEFCARPDLPDFDFIAVHGIWSWISTENHRTIVDFVRRKLKIGGMLYISYNTLPGFAATVPLRHLLSEHGEAMGTPGRGAIARVDAALEFVDKLFELNPAFANTNPGIVERLRLIKGQNRTYLAHEYFNRDWHATPFADMAKQLAPAKLTFACSAHYLDHIEAINLTPDQRQFIAAIPHPVFRQSVRDFIVNHQFRRDYWVKGARRLQPLEQAEAVRGQKIMLAGTRDGLDFNINGALGRREMASNVYGPILDALGDAAPKSIGEIEEALSGTEIRLATIFEAVMVLVGKGDLVVVQDEDVQARAKARVDRLNLAFFERARGSGDIVFLASPVTGGTGPAAGRFQQLFLLALRHGPKTADGLARFVWDILLQQGQRVAKDNKGLETPEENLAELETQARDFLDKRLPLFRKFQIA